MDEINSIIQELWIKIYRGGGNSYEKLHVHNNVYFAKVVLCTYLLYLLCLTFQTLTRLKYIHQQKWEKKVPF